MAHPPSLSFDARDSISRESPSLTCFIAGFRYHEGLDITNYLVLGERLDLIAEPGNPHDEHAVRIEHRKSHIGYVPRKYNQTVLAWLRCGMNVGAAIITVDWERPPWEAVQVLIVAQENQQQSAA